MKQIVIIGLILFLAWDGSLPGARPLSEQPSATPATASAAVGDLPILLTWYNPQLGGINCDSDCSTMADGLGWGVGDYGRVAACLPDWLGGYVTVGGYRLKCRDTGGAIVVEFNEHYGRWVIHVDVLSQSAIPCNYCLYEDWRFSWN